MQRSNQLTCSQPPFNGEVSLDPSGSLALMTGPGNSSVLLFSFFTARRLCKAFFFLAFAISSSLLWLLLSLLSLLLLLSSSLGLGLASSCDA